MRNKNKLIGRFVLIVFCCAVLFGACDDLVFADSSVKISVVQNGQSLSENSYSTQQLLNFGTSQAVYSSIDSSGSPELTSAKGVTISDLLAGLNIDPADVESIKFSSSDGWNRSYTKKFLLDTSRYYYAGLVSAQTVAEDGSVTYDTSKITQNPVQSMLAIQSYTERNAQAEDFSQIGSSNGIRICFGQETYDEVVSTKFGKNINKLEITIKDGASYSGNNESGNNQDENNNEDENNTDNPSVNPSDTFTITVGYYGGEYTEKKVYTMSELMALADYKATYSYIDSMPSVIVVSAIGVKVTDLLEDAGIDVNSVQIIHFNTVDGYDKSISSLLKTDLLDQNRYYFPQLKSHWDSDTASVTAGATQGAISVEPMISVQDNWNRKDTEPNFSNLGESNGFRILRGQTYSDVSKSTARESAKYIYGMEVQLGGTGEGTIKDTEVDPDQTVGSLFSSDLGDGKLVQLTDEQAASVENAIGMQKEDGAAVQKWRVYEMDENAVALDNIVLDNPWTPYIIGFLILCFIIGGFAKYATFRKQLGKGLLK